MPNSSVQIDVAEAMLTEIQAVTFSQTIAAARQCGEIDVALESDTNSFRVDIIPHSVKTGMADRKNVSYMVTTTVALRRKFPQSLQDADTGLIPNTYLDPCFVLLQELHDFWVPAQPGYSGRRLSTIPEASWQEGATIEAPYAMYLKEENQFVGLVRVIYEVVREANHVS